MESKEQPKAKVYVETTVISDATALPSNDLVLMGRQITTREWWATAAARFEQYSSAVVRREAIHGFTCPEICTPYQLQEDGGDA